MCNNIRDLWRFKIQRNWLKAFLLCILFAACYLIFDNKSSKQSVQWRWWCAVDRHRTVQVLTTAAQMEWHRTAFCRNTWAAPAPPAVKECLRAISPVQFSGEITICHLVNRRVTRWWWNPVKKNGKLLLLPSNPIWNVDYKKYFSISSSHEITD